jgi:ABC-2 type transport system ATP-binding protein
VTFLIEVKNLVKQYNGNTAVDDLSFTVEKGQIYGFLGPNGAGKSTTMNIMTGYLAPTSGDVSICGHSILEDGTEARKCIGYLPEIPPVYPDMTVQEYLDFAASLKKIPRKERSQAIADVMQMTDITSIGSRLIRNLSKGYRQRVGLAQAILGEPEVLILDEPMVGLDPKQIIEIRELIRSLARRHTVILSSHILSEISAICDHIMIIAHGRLVASGTPEELSRMMSGSDSVELTVKASEAEIRKLLKNEPQLELLSCAASDEADALDITVRTLDEHDCRESLFYLFAGHRIPLLRMQKVRASLEEVFLELTEGDVSAESLDAASDSTVSGRTSPDDAVSSDDNSADGSVDSSEKGGTRA